MGCSSVGCVLSCRPGGGDVKQDTEPAASVVRSIVPKLDAGQGNRGQGVVAAQEPGENPKRATSNEARKGGGPYLRTRGWWHEPTRI